MRADLLAAEDAHDLVHLGELIEQDILLPLGQAAGDDDPFDVPGAFPPEQLLDDPARLLPGRVDEPAGIDDDQVRFLSLGHQHKPVLRQQSEHSLGIDKVLGAAEADKRDRPFLRWNLAHATSEDPPNHPNARSENQGVTAAPNGSIVSMSIRDTSCHFSLSSSPVAV